MGPAAAGDAESVAGPRKGLACGRRLRGRWAPIMDSTITVSAPWRSGLRGARANLLPGMVLQLAALALVLGYYHDFRVHAALARLEEFRRSAGFAFGIVSTGVAGGILPFVYLHFGSRDRAGNPRFSWMQGLLLTGFWAYKGLEVDLWYRLQAHVFGSGHDAGTIALKVVMDQFGYCPLFAVPVTAAVYQAIDSRRGEPGLRADLRQPGWYRRRALPVLISNLGVWLPAVAILYSLPTPLQLPLQNIVLCFYTLIVAHQTRGELGPAGGPQSRSQ